MYEGNQHRGVHFLEPYLIVGRAQTLASEMTLMNAREYVISPALYSFCICDVCFCEVEILRRW